MSFPPILDANFTRDAAASPRAPVIIRRRGQLPPNSLAVQRRRLNNSDWVDLGGVDSLEALQPPPPPAEPPRISSGWSERSSSFALSCSRTPSTVTASYVKDEASQASDGFSEVSLAQLAELRVEDQDFNFIPPPTLQPVQEQSRASACPCVALTGQECDACLMRFRARQPRAAPSA